MRRARRLTRRLIGWVRSVAAPDPDAPPRTGLGPTAHKVEHVLSFGVAWLAAFRLVGVTVDSLAEPFLATFTTGYVYALAVVLGWLLLRGLRPAAFGHGRLRSFAAPLRPLALLLALTMALFVMGGPVHRGVASLIADLEEDTGLGGLLLSGALLLGEGIAFLAVSVALFATLWFGIRSRFRAGEVHPFLPGVADFVVAAISVGDALIRPSELFPFTLASAILLVAFAGTDVRLLAKAR